MRLYKKNNSKMYYYDFRLPNGQRRQGSTRQSTKAEALKIATKIEAAALAEYIEPTKPGLLFSEAYELYIKNKKYSDRTLVNYERSKKQWLKYMGDTPIAEYTSDTAARFVELRDADGAGRISTRNTLTRVRCILDFVEQHGQYAAPKLKMWTPETLDSESVGSDFLQLEEIEEIIALLKNHKNKAYIDYFITYIYTGCRHSEINRIRRRDVNFRANTVYIDGTKTAGAKRTLPIPPPLLPVLKQRCEAASSDDEPLFPNINHNLTVVINGRLKMDISHNTLRRTYCSLLLRGGVDMFAVAKLMGHTSTKQIMRIYGQLYPDTQQNAALAMPTFN